MKSHNFFIRIKKILFKIGYMLLADKDMEGISGAGLKIKHGILYREDPHEQPVKLKFRSNTTALQNAHSLCSCGKITNQKEELRFGSSGNIILPASIRKNLDPSMPIELSELSDGSIVILIQDREKSKNATDINKLQTLINETPINSLIKSW